MFFRTLLKQHHCSWFIQNSVSKFLIFTSIAHCLPWLPVSLYQVLKFWHQALQGCTPLQHPPLLLPFCVFTICLLHCIPLELLVLSVYFHFISLHLSCNLRFLEHPSKQIQKIIIVIVFKAVYTSTVSTSSRLFRIYCPVNDSLKKQNLFGTIA